MKKIKILLTSLILAAIALFVWLGYEIKSGQQQVANGSHQYAIVLGAKVKPGGVPSLSLKNRLDVAASYLTEHPNVTVIVSGGQGKDEDRTEASVMRDYLLERGIAQARIITEEQSTSTYENLLFSKKLLPPDTAAITIISNDFHLRRASFLAAELGLQSDVLAAKTPVSVELQSNLRERAALLKTFLIKK